MLEGTAIIVDDEEDICRLLSSYLSRRYKHVFYALTLNAGLALANQYKPELLILDNNLPDGIGIQMISDFRMTCRKILVISAMNNIQEEAMRAGADAFIAKPISFKDIETYL
jgi:DNA-binding response OmpR family regulator